MPGGRASSSKALDREELLRLDYATHLWIKKRIQSVAQFLELAAALPLRPEVQTCPLAAAAQALVPGEP
jgi:propanol-preferring alcohol dehydrogenase